MRTLLALLCILTLTLTSTPVVAAEEAHAEKKAEGKKEEGKKEEGKGGGEGGEKEKAKGPSDVSGGRFTGDPVYVHLSPMVIPVITENGSEQIVTILIDIEVRDFDVADNVHTNMSRINDALVRSLYGGLSDGDLRKGKVVNVSKLKARATAALGEVVGKEGIRDVLIQGIAQRIL